MYHTGQPIRIGDFLNELGDEQFVHLIFRSPLLGIVIVLFLFTSM